MKLNSKTIQEKIFWEKAGFSLPKFDHKKIISNTLSSPKWVHFGAGNIFRAYPAALCQKLLDEGIETTGIIAAEGFDTEIISKCFDPFDNLSILVTLKSDGTIEKKVIASIAKAVKMDTQIESLKEIFCKPSLQMASFTITEKGYSLKDRSGNLFSEIADDIKTGHSSPKTFLGQTASLCYERYIRGKLPLAMVSMDNCSHNGDILFNVIETFAKGWLENGHCDEGFLKYVQDKTRLSFPWTMIDKITPSPDDSVFVMLKSCELEDMQAVVTAKNTYIAPFVNAEETQYLVIEDNFPNGRPTLEKAGVFFTTREIVNKVEKMKVCTCLNPLHTALSIFGYLFGYKLISGEMKDADLVNLIKGIGYTEGLPVVTDPGIINPKDFIDQVINVRLPNPFMPDTPYRIALDTSVKIPIRFGETIKAYKKSGLNCGNLKYIPLFFAGWLRYLLGIDDQGNQYEISPDPNYQNLAADLSGIKLGQKGPFSEILKPILSNQTFFGVNLYEEGLGDKVEALFAKMLEGRGAVRQTLKNSFE